MLKLGIFKSNIKEGIKNDADRVEIGLALKKISIDLDFNLIVPNAQLCTDNAAIIASAGSELFIKKLFSPETLIARPRWPLDEHAAPMIGFGKKGRKA